MITVVFDKFEDLIRNWIDFNADVTFFYFFKNFGMFDSSETVTNAFGAKENGINLEMLREERS